MGRIPADKQTSLSVIIPAYNEARRITANIERIGRYCEDRFWPLEVIVVDNGSNDGTADMVGAMLGRLPWLRLERARSNRGKGAAVRAGMLRAESDLLLMCDADLSAPIEEVEKLLPWVGRGFDVVCGSRAAEDSVIERQPIHRHLMGKVFGVMVRHLALRGIRDSQCGFKLFTRSAARKIFASTRIDGFAFDVEVLLLAGRLGYGVREVGIAWHHVPHSHVRLFSDPWRMAADLLRIICYDRTGRYRLR